MTTINYHHFRYVSVFSVQSDVARLRQFSQSLYGKWVFRTDMNSIRFVRMENRPSNRTEETYTHKPEWNQYAAFNIRSLVNTTTAFRLSTREAWAITIATCRVLVLCGTSTTETLPPISHVTKQLKHDRYALAHWKISLSLLFRSVVSSPFSILFWYRWRKTNPHQCFVCWYLILQENSYDLCMNISTCQ